jgi:4-amino-4-deoxy-L-arabinose transferase-like glycosyltransferase
MAALSLGVMAVSLLLIAHIRGRNFWYIASGFSAALGFLSKQNLGFAVVASVIVGAVYLTMISNKNYRWNKVGYVCLGIGGGIFIFVGWLLASGTFSSFLNNFMLNIWQKIVIEGTIATPVVYGNSFYSFAKFIFYISGALLGVFALILSYRKRSPLFVGALFSLLFTLTGIRPVTDFVHIAPLFATLGIVIIILYRLSSYSLVRGALLLYTFFLLLIGFYIPIFVSYYRWSPPYREQTMFAAYPRARIFIDRKSNETILQLINTLNTRSSQNEYIFINYYAPMVYFLLDRQNATKYDYISPTAISIREQLDAIDSLEKRNVRFILTHELARHDSSVLAKYILAYFRKIKQVGDFAIWERKRKEVTSH